MTTTPAPSEAYYFSGTPAKDSLRHMVAGAFSGFVSKIAEYPLDSIKVLQQTLNYKGPLAAFKSTVQTHGFFSLYRGVSTAVAAAMLEDASLFTSYEEIKRQMGGDPSSLVSSTLAGMGAGVGAAFILTPIELVKCKMQIPPLGSRPYTGPGDVVIRVVKSEGLRGLYRGHVSCLFREVLGNGAWFGVYEGAVRSFQSHLGAESREEVPLFYKGISGSLAGCAYWAVPYPFDTVKSVIQTNTRFSGWKMTSVFSTVFREAGFKGLYRGLPVTLVRAAPAHALVFITFEWTSSKLSAI